MELRCPNCGAGIPVQREEVDVVMGVSAETLVVLKCDDCHQTFPAHTIMMVKPRRTGGVSVSGNNVSVDGDLVGRDKTTVNGVTTFTD